MIVQSIVSQAEGRNMSKPAKASPRFEIFRRSDAPSLEESGVLTASTSAEPDAEGMGEAIQAGIDRGYTTKVLYATPQFSLIYLWYKSGFPLPRHSHDADCLYVVVGGSLRIGTEDLGPGDGFFVGAEVPYAYTAGEMGVEVLEFRSVGTFDIKLLAGDAFWRKAAERARSKQTAWSAEDVSPSRITSQIRGEQELTEAGR
jgi:hypothetical protein